jgi:hypothetical protein
MSQAAIVLEQSISCMFILLNRDPGHRVGTPPGTLLIDAKDLHLGYRKPRLFQVRSVRFTSVVLTHYLQNPFVPAGGNQVIAKDTVAFDHSRSRLFEQSNKVGFWQDH